MRQPEKKRRTVGIRGQLMWFLCFICLLLLVLFWFLCTQLLEPLYTTHIQKQLTEQADAIVQKLDDAIADGQTLSYWGFGSQLYVNSQFFNQLSSEIYRKRRHEQLLCGYLRCHAAADLQGGEPLLLQPSPHPAHR